MISLDQDDMNQALSLTKAGRLAEGNRTHPADARVPLSSHSIHGPHHPNLPEQLLFPSRRHRPTRNGRILWALPPRLCSAHWAARLAAREACSSRRNLRTCCYVKDRDQTVLGRGRCSTRCIKTIRAPGDTRSTFPLTPSDMLQSLSCCMAGRSRFSTTPQGPA